MVLLVAVLSDYGFYPPPAGVRLVKPCGYRPGQKQDGPDGSDHDLADLANERDVAYPERVINHWM